MENNLALKLPVIESDAELDRIRIGNSRYTDDIWDIRPLVASKSIRDSQKYIRFVYISNENMKKTVKQYAYYKLGKVKAKTVRDYINSNLPKFIEYCLIQGIRNFAEMTLDDYLKFNIWMKEEKKVSAGAGFKTCHVVEEIIRIGQIKGWNVPQMHLPKAQTAFQIWYQKRSMVGKNKTKPIPKKIFDKILCHAVHDEKDILTKAGIIIQSQTGIRISEVLSIKEGCVKTTSDGYDYMEVLIGKTEKGEPILHKIFINELTKNVILELSAATKCLRNVSGFKELFLVKMGKIRVVKSNSWSERRLPGFVKRWDIRDDKGKLYHLNSHQFRATFVRELIKQKVPILVPVRRDSLLSPMPSK